MFKSIEEIQFYYINSTNDDNFELYTDFFANYNINFEIINPDSSYVIKQKTLEDINELRNKLLTEKHHYSDFNDI